ncbi:MAG: HAMP domain-containing histidine kinase [Shewanella sp.]|nr:HAMP domain-containing histidine kinase [Shewanella sp.]MCF1431370.1 HAMP domain-containing histidine kinase [Shewanella sp.]MCF1439507.1 HAMP domain-containing histidine kinase [Shewanella sp.]MCF1458265.1 HAMP domain-containing histidine kinase [Shewanella sp.]
MTLIIGALLFGMYRELILEQQHQVEIHLESERIHYQQLALTASRQAFAAQVRTADPKSILVVWQHDDQLEGALSFMPLDMPMLPETKEFPILSGGLEKLHLFTGGLVQTRYGPVLLASRTDQLATLIDKFISAAATAVVVTILLTLVGGYLFSKALLLRVVNYNRLSRLIEQGHYDTRFPISEHPDEFDMMATQFNRVLDTLQNNLDAVRGVTDNIAHDLRTPLSHIRIGLEQLASRSSDDVAESCAVLIEELEMCLATFNAMLSLTRIEEGQQQLELQSVSLSELCCDLEEMASAVAEMQEQQLSLQTGVDCVITGDKHLLFMALYNLIDNAMKYSGEGTDIRIEQEGAMIRISDNGPGIPDSDKDRVFGRLVRLDPSRHHTGTGLGLSMVKAILSRHQAQIELSDNHPGLQVTITFRA